MTPIKDATIYMLAATVAYMITDQAWVLIIGALLAASSIGRHLYAQNA